MTDLYEILKIGTVISVKGRFIEVKVETTKNSSHLLYKGELIKNVSVGSYIKISKGFEELIGKIEGEYITEDKSYVDKEYFNDKEKIKRILNISLLGFFENNCFKRGVKELPLINNECSLLTNYEFNLVHNFVKSDDESIEIGCLAQEKGKRIAFGLNSLFASHIGVFGNTGSGKSYTLAKLYQQLFEKYKDKVGFQKNAKFVLIDFNGEYANSDLEEDDNIIVSKHHKKVLVLCSSGKRNKYSIEKKSIENVEILSILLEATEKTQTPFLKRALDYKKLRDLDISKIQTFIKEEFFNEIMKKSDKELGIKIILNFLSDLYHSIENNEKIGEIKQFIELNLKQHTRDNNLFYENGSTKYYGDKDNDKNNFQTHFTDPLFVIINSITFKNTVLNHIRIRIMLRYYKEIISGHSNKEHLSPLISRIHKRFNELDCVIEIKETLVTLDKPLTIISLKDINDTSIKKVLPLIICKQLYDKQKKVSDKKSYLNFIIDEAHNILSYSSLRESEQWKDYRLETFEEIIKEGRKFGVFLTIASQRPSDISPTILSQLHNYFLHRLINNNDILAVEKTISYLDKVSFESLPILPTGTCIFAGLSAQVPVVIEIDEICDEHKPRNQTIRPSDFWK